MIASHYYGRAGAFILAFTVTFACLKTSIGLITSLQRDFLRHVPPDAEL
ncbi:MAG: branched-chain amino acid transport system II carrier protein [[Clostridium] scindens]